MKKKKLFNLIMGLSILGFSIVIIYFMGQAKKYEERTDALRDTQKRILEERDAVQNKVFTASESCANVSAGIIPHVCLNQVYDDVPENVIPWTTGISDAAANCLAESYFLKMEKMDMRMGKVFDKSNHDDDEKIISHACTINSDFEFWIHDFKLKDEGVDVAQALNLWHQFVADKYCGKSKEHSWCKISGR